MAAVCGRQFSNLIYSECSSANLIEMSIYLFAVHMFNTFPGTTIVQHSVLDSMLEDVRWISMCMMYIVHVMARNEPCK